MRLEIESDVSAPHIESVVNQENLPESGPSGSDSRLNQGISAARSGDRSLARTLLGEVTDEDPANAEAWLWLASISEYPEELLGFLNNVLAVDPENERATQWKTATGALLSKTFVQRGMAAMDDNDELAEECFNSAISHDPRSEAAWFGKASLAKDDGERTECLERVLKVNPDHVDAKASLHGISQRQIAQQFLAAQTAAVSGDWNSASTILDQLFASDANHVGGWTLRSHFSPTLEEKMAAFDRLLVIDTKDRWAKTAKQFLTKTASAVRERPAPTEAAIFETIANDPVENVDKSSEPLELPGEVPALKVSGDPEMVRDCEVANEGANDVAIDDELRLTEQSPNSDDDSTEAKELLFGAVETSAAVETSDELIHSEHTFAAELNSNSPVENFEDEPLSNRLVPELLAAQATDERMHEYLTGDAVSLPPGFDLGRKDTEVVDSETETTTESYAVQTTDEANEPINFSEAEPTDHSATELVVGGESIDESESDAPTTIEDINAEFSNYDVPFDTANDNHQAASVANSQSDAVSHLAASSVSCPFCLAITDQQAFQCQGCQSILTLSDIDTLLSDIDCDGDMIMRSVTQMEAAWNLREFDQAELTILALGYFNLKNPERGLAYLQEASRLAPNDVILAGQANALAIRLAELRRQNENHEAMPKGKTILVVDDSATVRKLISSKLEKSGHNVVTAVDGIEAMELLDDLVPDLVLLDIAMPRMDGYSVCKLIRANESVRSVPVVMISGKDGFFDKVRGRMAGTTGYVTKPFGPETLMRALETYLVPDGHVEDSNAHITE